MEVKTSTELYAYHNVMIELKSLKEIHYLQFKTNDNNRYLSSCEQSSYRRLRFRAGDRKRRLLSCPALRTPVVNIEIKKKKN